MIPADLKLEQEERDFRVLFSLQGSFSLPRLFIYKIKD